MGDESTHAKHWCCSMLEVEEVTLMREASGTLYRACDLLRASAMGSECRFLAGCGLSSFSHASLLPSVAMLNLLPVLTYLYKSAQWRPLRTATSDLQVVARGSRVKCRAALGREGITQGRLEMRAQPRDLRSPAGQ